MAWPEDRWRHKPPRNGWPAKNDEAARRAADCDCKWCQNTARESWALWCEELMDELGRAICGRPAGSTTEQGGKFHRPCTQPAGFGIPNAIDGNCKHHGPRLYGEDNPAYRHGRNTELAGPLTSAADRRMGDARWWDMQEEVARLRGLIDLLVGAADRADMVMLNDDFLGEFDGLVDALRRGDMGDGEQHLRRMRELRADAAGWRSAATELRRTAEALSRIVARDVRNRATAAEVVTRSQLSGYLEATDQLVRSEVLDRIKPHVPGEVLRDCRQRLSTGIRALLQASEGRQLQFMHNGRSANGRPTRDGDGDA